MFVPSSSSNVEVSAPSSLRLLHRLSSQASNNVDATAAAVSTAVPKLTSKDLAHPPLGRGARGGGGGEGGGGIELPQLFPANQGRTGRALLRAIPRNRSNSPASRHHKHQQPHHHYPQQQQRQQQQELPGGGPQPKRQPQLLGASRRGGDLAAALAEEESSSSSHCKAAAFLQPRRSSSSNSNTNLYVGGGGGSSSSNSTSVGNNFLFAKKNTSTSNAGGSSSSQLPHQQHHIRSNSKVRLPSLLPPISAPTNGAETPGNTSLAGDADLAAALQSRSRARVREQRERERKREEDADARRREESMLKRQRAEEKAPELQAQRREIARRAAEVFQQHRSEVETAMQEKEEVLSARREKANRYKTPQSIREHQSEHPWMSPRRRAGKESRNVSKSTDISLPGEGSSASSSSRTNGGKRVGRSEVTTHEQPDHISPNPLQEGVQRETWQEQPDENPPNTLQEEDVRKGISQEVLLENPGQLGETAEGGEENEQQQQQQQQQQPQQQDLPSPNGVSSKLGSEGEDGGFENSIAAAARKEENTESKPEGTATANEERSEPKSETCDQQEIEARANNILGEVAESEAANVDPDVIGRDDSALEAPSSAEEEEKEEENNGEKAEGKAPPEE